MLPYFEQPSVTIGSYTLHLFSVLVAIGILAGAVSGRYHYAVDAVAGAVVGIAAFAMALRI